MNTGELVSVKSSSLLEDTPSEINESVLRCAGRIAWESIPNILNLITISVVSSINILYISHNTDPNLSGVAVGGLGTATTWISLTASLVFIGLNTGFSAITAQAFGSKNYELVGLYLHRAIILRVIIFFFSFFLLLFSEQILTTIGIPAQSTAYAGTYCRYAIPGVFMLSLSETLKSYIISQSIFRPLFYFQLIGTLTHWGCCHVFVHVLRMGIIGAAYAFDLSQTVILILTIVYLLKWNPNKESFFGFRKESFSKLWWQFSKEAQIAIFMYVEWIAYELILILTGLLGEMEMQSFIVFLNITSFLYMPGAGIGITLSTYVGNAMGEGSILNVKKYMKSAALLWVILTFLSIIPMISLADIAVGWYTEDEKLIKAAAGLMRVYAVYYAQDIGQVFAIAVIKGIGKERVGTKIFISTLYGLGFLPGYLFAFYFDYKTPGFLYGMVIGVTVMFLLEVQVIRTTDLEEQIQIIKQRIAESKSTPLLKNGDTLSEADVIDIEMKNIKKE